jgi:hypothetical protein
MKRQWRRFPIQRRLVFERILAVPRPVLAIAEGLPVSRLLSRST